MKVTGRANFVAAGAGRIGLRQRRGIASVLAMLYLIIFSTLAIGFYGAVTMAVQIANNDERANGARLAAESGMEFIRHQIHRVSFRGDTPEAQVLQEVYNDLLAQCGASPNLAGRPMGLTPGRLEVPAGATNFIPLDTRGAGFRAVITNAGGGNLLVQVTGRYRGTTMTRTIEEEFESVYRSLNIFDFGIVTRGPININGGGMIGGGLDPTHGSILSLSDNPVPISMSGTSGIAGDAYMTNRNGVVDISGGGVSIGRETIPALRETHIHRGVDRPDLPDPDSSIFKPFATNAYRRGQSTYRNVIIPPNADPNFTNDVTIEGVMYIQYPNKVSFGSKVSIRGTIVVENGATPGRNNAISFGGGVEAFGMDTLPPDTDFPEALRKLRGSTLIAPGFSVSVSGHSGAIGGVMLANSFEFAGGSGGVIEGTFIGLGDVPMTFTGGASISRTRGPYDVIPAGLVFNKTFKPKHKTYREVMPNSGPTVPVVNEDGDFGYHRRQRHIRYHGAMPPDA